MCDGVDVGSGQAEVTNDFETAGVRRQVERGSAALRGRRRTVQGTAEPDQTGPADRWTTQPHCIYDLCFVSPEQIRMNNETSEGLQDFLNLKTPHSTVQDLLWDPDPAFQNH